MYDLIKNTDKDNFEFLKNIITISFKNNRNADNYKLEEIERLTEIFMNNDIGDCDLYVKQNLEINNCAPVFMGFDKQEQYKYIIRNNQYE